jgi:hypothetical protein
MAINPDLRLKIRHFFKKHKRVIIIIVVTVLIVILINRLLMKMRSRRAPQVTYKPHTSVLDTTSSVPTKVADGFEDFIDKYINYCNNRNYVEAYNLISEDCKKNFFDNSYNSFVDYVSQKFDSTKRYAIQNYSNYDGKYIYTVKIFDDFLATGLTGQSYRYQEEKITASYDDNKNVVFSVGNYIQSKKLNYMASNNYLKAEVTEVMQKYSFSVYTLKLTNRSNYTIVVKDGNIDAIEVGLYVGQELRGTQDNDTKIIIPPGETITVSLAFSQFFDSSIEASGIVLDAVRVMESYTGNPENIDSEIENAVDKFSMTIAF